MIAGEIGVPLATLEAYGIDIDAAGIVDGEQVQAQGRVEHFGAQAVSFHLFHSRARIPAAGMLLKTFTDLMRRKQRRGVAVFLRHAFFPQVHRFHDMGIG